jgi:Tfp pilus assembly protein PilF
MGNADLAMAEHRRALEIEPNYGLGLHFMGRSALSRGDRAEAVRLFRKSNEILGNVMGASGAVHG